LALIGPLPAKGQWLFCYPKQETNKIFYKFRESGCKNIPFVGHLSDREAGKGAAMPAPGAFRRSRYDNHNRQFHKIEDGSIDF